MKTYFSFTYLGVAATMNTNRYILASLAGFVFLFAFDFVLHGVLLHSTYMETAQLWRPEGESQFWVMMLSQLLFAFTTACFFVRHQEGKGLNEGLRFGCYLGLIIASLTLGTYFYLPISAGLTVSWMLGDVLRCVGFGGVLALVYKK
jgi:hypothetical protein